MCVPYLRPSTYLVSSRRSRLIRLMLRSKENSASLEAALIGLHYQRQVPLNIGGVNIAFNMLT
jgi:hypothetical protein